jgi:hypothetical protein
MHETIWGDGVVRVVKGMCSLARVSDTLGMKHAVGEFGLTLTSTYLG